jgi:hypothetical protein
VQERLRVGKYMRLSQGVFVWTEIVVHERIVVVDVSTPTEWNAFEIKLIIFYVVLDVSTGGMVMKPYKVE